jgi:pimeloyl-ACP methyl ester carboxylesterase
MESVGAHRGRWLGRSLLAATALVAAACRGGGATSVEPQRGVAPVAARGDASPVEGRAGVLPTSGEAVSIRTTDGWTLVGDYRGGDSGTVVLLVHQLSSNRTEWGPLLSLLQPARGVRYPTLAIDLRGHGGSTQGPEGTTSWQAFGTDAARWQGVVDDVAAAVRYLRTRPRPPTGIVIVGSSIGSSAALRYAAGDAEITAVVLLSPGLAYRGLDTRDAMARYASTARPALLLASDGDTGSAEAIPALLERARGDARVESEIYPGTGAHGVSIGAAGVHPELWQRIDGWIRALHSNGGGRDY